MMTPITTSSRTVPNTRSNTWAKCGATYLRSPSNATITNACVTCVRTKNLTTCTITTSPTAAITTPSVLLHLPSTSLTADPYVPGRTTAPLLTYQAERTMMDTPYTTRTSMSASLTTPHTNRSTTTHDGAPTTPLMAAEYQKNLA